MDLFRQLITNGCLSLITSPKAVILWQTAAIFFLCTMAKLFLFSCLVKRCQTVSKPSGTDNQHTQSPQLNNAPEAPVCCQGSSFWHCVFIVKTFIAPRVRQTVMVQLFLLRWKSSSLVFQPGGSKVCVAQPLIQSWKCFSFNNSQLAY